jgi:quaternary ammonium compound-resistance protein SugE
MAWILLLLAGVCEVVWAVCSKHANGFTRFWPSAMTIVFNIVSVVLLILAMKRLPLGTSYAVWTGIGAVGTVAYGIWRFNEPKDWPRLGCIALIILGIVGLKLLAPTAE